MAAPDHRSVPGCGAGGLRWSGAGVLLACGVGLVSLGGAAAGAVVWAVVYGGCG